MEIVIKWTRLNYAVVKYTYILYLQVKNENRFNNRYKNLQKLYSFEARILNNTFLR